MNNNNKINYYLCPKVRNNFKKGKKCIYSQMHHSWEKIDICLFINTNFHSTFIFFCIHFREQKSKHLLLANSSTIRNNLFKLLYLEPDIIQETICIIWEQVKQTCITSMYRIIGLLSYKWLLFEFDVHKQVYNNHSLVRG